MSLRKLREILLFTLMTSVATQVAAENSGLIYAFGGDPGSPLTHAYSNGLPQDAGPTYTLRIAVMSPSIKDVFQDTVLTISAPEKIVQKVVAARAFRMPADCDTARDVVFKELAKALPREYGSPDEQWQLQSADGNVIARAVCTKRRHDPMPVLSMEIALRQ